MGTFSAFSICFHHYKQHLTPAAVAPEVSWYAGLLPSGSNDDESAIESGDALIAVNSVTQASFPGKEIVTPTIVEEVSFRAWGLMKPLVLGGVGALLCTG